jgi:hypothetical protein
MTLIERVFGIRPAQPGDDTAADQAIREAVAESFCAQDQLRANIRHDPHFAGTICKALGCEQDGCADPLGAIARRVTQIPGVVARVVAGQGQVLPFPHD